MGKQRRLQEGYRFDGLRPLATVRGVFGDPKARIVALVRRRKKRHVAPVGGGSAVFTTADAGWCGTWRAPIGASTWTWKSAASRAGAVGA
jgi:hypothetical protein